LILDGHNGRIVPPANVEALAEALGQLAGEPELRCRLGLHARETVERRYNLADNLDQLAAMWSKRLV
jgi:glycosyltransferase involved in cell wall biosynthesis